MITIHDSPEFFSPKGQKLIYIATSTNVANTGFKYKVTVVLGTLVDIATLYITPNPANSLVFDVAPIIRNYIRTAYHDSANNSIHKIAGSDQYYMDDLSVGGEWSRSLVIAISEAWEVDGVLTDDPDSVGAVDSDVKYIINAFYQPELGYKPAQEDYFKLDSSTDNLMTDRVYSTHSFDYAESIGFTQDNETVFIPVREQDYGVMVVQNACNPDFPEVLAEKIVLRILQSNGVTTSAFEIPILNVGKEIFYTGMYPANINASTMVGIPKPSAYPNWKALYFYAADNSGNQVSITYVMYNVAHSAWQREECFYPNVRIAWTNSRGGWDYFNFIKKSTESLEIERRRYHKIAGNYATATTSFEQNTFDRGETETANNVKRFLNVNSVWLQDGEYDLLQSLLTSTDVHIVNDDGTHTPVLIEDSSFVKRKYENTRTQLQLKLKYSQQYSS